jgi:hypothetical protein
MAKKQTPVGATDNQGPGSQVQKWQPTYQQNAEVDSHLFELKTGKMLKNLSWRAEKPDIRDIEHQHFFHSHDSSGREMTHSTSTGGHFHVIEVGTDPKTGAPVAKCSGPKTYMHKKGKKFLVDLPAFKSMDQNGKEIVDTHTHNVVYARSSLVKPRTVNAESIKIIDQLETSKEAPIPGIQG